MNLYLCRLYNQMKKNILITGGAGFIGSHVVRLMVTKYPEYQIFNLDALTYAGNLENLKDIEKAANYHFIKANILEADSLKDIFEKHAITDVIHLAAESHVDRSIVSPLDFVYTNVIGTVNLLNTAKEYWKGDLSYEKAHDGSWDNQRDHLFYHVSTDEVFGSLGLEGFFTETTPYDPRSPYSASKAASDHFVSAYYHTYGFPVKRSNCSNNYGSNHHPEKLIPLMINNILNKKPLPVYGEGINVRDWLWVEDHARAIDVIFHQGAIGCNYNVGGWNEWRNIDLIHELCRIMDRELDRKEGESAELITYVKDRAGHDMRYAIDATKLFEELGWKPSITFQEGLQDTVKWYLENQDWVKEVTSGAYQEYYNKLYTQR